MAEREHADVLEVVVSQPAQQLEVDVVGAEHFGILVETDPAEPTFDVQVSASWALVSAVFEKVTQIHRRPAPLLAAIGL
jgi:hypothetical protein